MRKRSKICLYVFLICAFVALGILGYFVLYPHSDDVRVGNRKFVTLAVVPQASSYELYTETNDEPLTYTVSRQDTSDKTSNIQVLVQQGDRDVALEKYSQSLVYNDNDKVDCNIYSYSIILFSSGDIIYLEDSVVEDVSGDFFCTAIGEYLKSLFIYDGQFELHIIPIDEYGMALEGQDSIVYYDYFADSEEDFLRRDKYYYKGEWLDYVIESREELKKLVFWTILYRQAECSDLTFFIKTDSIDKNNINKLVKEYINSYPEYDALEDKSVYATASGNIGRLSNFEYYLDDNFLLTYRDLRAMDTSSNKSVYNLAVSQLHQKDDGYFQGYITRNDDDEREFAINGDDVDEVVVYNSEQLYMVLESGARPLFVDGESDVARDIYYNALSVLEEINDSDNLTDYEKVTNIYRYLTSQIVYDYVSYYYMQLKNDYSIRNFGNLSCFYLESVFYDFGLDNHYAVCDGLSKAFSIMCNIEGIYCYKVNGIVSGGNHAWNRVALYDETLGLDGEYYVDTTWGEGTYEEDGQNYQLLTHTYYLFKLNTKEREISYPENMSPESIFDYYKHTYYAIDDSIYDCYIDSDDELQAILSYKSQCAIIDGSAVAELEMSSSYLNDKNSIIYRLNRLDQDVLWMNKQIASINNHIVEVEGQIAKLKAYGSWGFVIQNYEQELDRSRTALGEYQSSLENIESERMEFLSSLGITSQYEYVTIDNVYVFKFFR